MKAKQKNKILRPYKYAVLLPPRRDEQHTPSAPAKLELMKFMWQHYKQFEVATKPIMVTTLCLKIKAKALSMPEYAHRVRPWKEVVEIIKLISQT